MHRVVLAFVLCGVAAAQQDFSQVKIAVTPVGGVVSMLEGQGGNVAVSVGPDGVLMVDTQFAELKDRLLAAIATLQPPGTPRFVVNTHWHGDHTGGNAGLGRAADGGTGAVIIAQDNVRVRMAAGSARQGPAEPAALPLITYADGLTLHFNGEDVRLRHFANAHTDGDSALFFPTSKVAHLGDMFFNQRFPFVDLSSGGDVVGLERAVGEVLKELPADWKIVPGHGPLATRTDLETYHRMLTESIAHVRKAIAAGQSKEAVMAAGLPAEWQAWSWQFVNTDRWLGTVFESLKAAPDGPPAAH